MSLLGLETDGNKTRFHIFFFGQKRRKSLAPRPHVHTYAPYVYTYASLLHLWIHYPPQAFCLSKPTATIAAQFPPATTATWPRSGRPPCHGIRQEPPARPGDLRRPHPSPPRGRLGRALGLASHPPESVRLRSGPRPHVFKAQTGKQLNGDAARPRRLGGGVASRGHPGLPARWVGGGGLEHMIWCMSRHGLYVIENLRELRTCCEAPIPPPTPNHQLPWPVAAFLVCSAGAAARVGRCVGCWHTWVGQVW